ncbi:MAG: TSUP family transporter [Actinobacteria bacterium]|nr:TSUP family transporter [Actinomycetota bacterium]
MSPAEVAVVILFGVAIGFFSALFGVGGGVFIVPFVVFVLGESQHFAEGTSLLAIVPIASIGVIAHARSRLVRWREAWLLALGGAAGAVAGVLLAYELSGNVLRKAFALFLLTMAARTIYGMLRPGPAGDPIPPAAG